MKSPQLELAQTRLNQFCSDHDASIEEVAMCLSMRVDRLEEMATAEDWHVYADEIVCQLGSEMLPETERKLAELRVANPVPQKAASAPEKKSTVEKKLNHKAADMLYELKGKDSWNTVAEKLNPHASRVYKGAQLACRFAPSGIDDVSDKFAQGVIDAIVACKAASNQTGKSDTAEAPAKPTAESTSEPDITQEPISETCAEPDIDDTRHDGLDAEEPAKAGHEAEEEACLHFVEVSDMAVKAAAQDLIEEALGLPLDELMQLKPQIEMMAVAKRNGVPACLQIDPVEV